MLHVLKMPVVVESLTLSVLNDQNLVAYLISKQKYISATSMDYEMQCT